MKRSCNCPDTEPDQKKFDIVSEGEHLFQVVEVFDHDYDLNRFGLDENTVLVKCEVVEGNDVNRSLLNRLSLDTNWKGFFATRLFLKAIGEPYKGQFDIDTESWVGRRFYAVVVHNQVESGKVYANIESYNYDREVRQFDANLTGSNMSETCIAWDD